MPAGSTITYLATGTIAVGATGSLGNTATVSAPGGVTDPNTGNNSATDTDTLTPQNDVTVTKTDSSTTAVPGATTTYTIVVSNNGLSTATSVAVSDPLPAGVTGFTWSGNGHVSVVGPLNDTIASLAPGATVTYTVTAQINSSASGSLANTVTVTAANDTNPNNNSATDTDTLTPQNDVTVTKTDGTTTAVPGASTTYTIVVSNNGPSDASNVSVSDPLPSGIWTVGTVNVGSPQTLTITATVINPNPSANTAAVSASDQFDPNPANNIDSSSVNPQEADLSLSKSVSDATPNVGDVVTFTVTLTNNGPKKANNVDVTDLLPSGLTFVSANPSQGTYAPATGLWNVGNLDNQEQVILTLQAQVTSPDAKTNTASITNSNRFDPNPDNNTASATETPQQADLAITKSVSNPTPNVGDTINFTVTLNNTGPNTATNVVVDDLLPAGLTFVAAVPSQGSYDSTTGLWSARSAQRSHRHCFSPPR